MDYRTEVKDLASQIQKQSSQILIAVPQALTLLALDCPFAAIPYLANSTPHLIASLFESMVIFCDTFYASHRKFRALQPPRHSEKVMDQMWRQ